MTTSKKKTKAQKMTKQKRSTKARPTKAKQVCFLRPWLKPTFDLRKFPVGSTARFEVVNGHGTLSPNPSSWHNEFHPSKDGFKKFATLFHTKLKALFPARVL